MTQRRVLVTGGSGFIAGHLILQLLERGDRVRATIRSTAKEPAARDVLTRAGMTSGESLEFVAADLTRDAGWAEAMTDIDVVAHVASPVLPGHVTDENQVIAPAREGTLRVLRAAQAAGVRRVVLTSAFHAVGWGHPHDDHLFTEDDWTVLDGPGVDAYAKAKTLAEQAAWEFVESTDGGMELTTMLPVAVMGPVMGEAISGANQVVQRLLAGRMPGLPNIYLPVVDVRDVAGAHLLALDIPEAAGNRFLLAAGPALSLAGIAELLRTRLGEAAEQVPTRRLPDLVVRAGGVFSRELRGVAADLGYARRASYERAETVLGWHPRPSEEAVIAAAQSMIARDADPRTT